MSPSISAERLLRDLEALAAIGGRSDGGVDRLAGSEADREGRLWVADRMREAGLTVQNDPVGNVVGRPPGPPPWLLLGSHTDTVPAGGRLDGAYGVVAALEVARVLRHPRLAVIDFADEEGAVGGGGVTGSTALAGSPDMADFAAYLELHIEQGPRLEAEGLDLGVVEAIVGIDRWDVTWVGAANHAGTTPMEMRRDAGAAAGWLMFRLRTLLAGVDPQMVGNIGEIRLLPGAANVVPGEAQIVVELRADRRAILDSAAAVLREAVAAAASEFGCSFEMKQRSTIEPSPMDAAVGAILASACERSGRGWRRLVSGAGHDAGVMARKVPAGMLFVPSRGGVSHNPAEHTDEGLLVLGCQTLLEGGVEILSTLEKPST